MSGETTMRPDDYGSPASRADDQTPTPTALRETTPPLARHYHAIAIALSSAEKIAPPRPGSLAARMASHGARPRWISLVCVVGALVICLAAAMCLGYWYGDWLLPG